MGLNESGRVVRNQEGLRRWLHCVLHCYTDGALWNSAPHHRKGNSSTNTSGLFEMLREAGVPQSLPPLVCPAWEQGILQNVPARPTLTSAPLALSPFPLTSWAVSTPPRSSTPLVLI